MHGEGFFILLHAEDNNNWSNFLDWKPALFGLELVDKEKCLSDFQCTKEGIIRLHHIFGLSEKYQIVISFHKV